jgi:UDP-N-acetylmuramoylalanine--D-glutamate ligase
VDAAIKAIQAFAGRLILILGGTDKGGDFRPLRDLLRQRAKKVLLIGAAAGKIAEHLGDAVATENAETLPEALERAAGLAVPGDIVLLAPACASFDQFENYEHRGRVFKEEVRRLAQASRAGKQVHC